MKVVLETSFVDIANGIDAESGDEVEINDEVAARLIERGSATPVAAPAATKRQTRTKTATEKRG